MGEFIEGFVDGALSALVRRETGREVVRRPPRAYYSDWREQGVTFSVESIVADTLSNLACTGFTMPISGQSTRALELDAVSDSFVRGDLQDAMALGFASGDCLVVPIWTGSTFTNAVVPATDFEIVASAGGKPTAVAYVVDQRREATSTFQLVQLMELVPYVSQDGTETNACRYRLAVARNGSLSTATLADFPEWAGRYTEEWFVPNVDRLLLGRYKCFVRDKRNPNAEYGTPLCFGAGQHVREIHYLVDQLHNEFELSEKAIVADKTSFAKDRSGNLILPRGRERLFMNIRGRSVEGTGIEEWAPSIQNTPYAEALELHKRGVEKCIGVDSGILSTPVNTGYENVDNVRKSMRNTMAFVNHARGVAEEMLGDLVYSWDALLNLNGHEPGEFEVKTKWSDDYINTFSDQRDALISGYGIGATDAVDYRIFVMGESPEQARQRVEEIKAGKTLAFEGAE